MNSKVFDQSKPLIGVLQLLPLPGSLEWKGRIDQVIARAEQEATALATGGVDGILVENTFDAPYASGRMDPAGAIAMGLIIRRIMHFTHLPIGVSVLKNDPETAMAIAMNVGARFIRVGLLTGAALTDTGLMEGKYRDLQRYRQQLQVEGIQVFADVSLNTVIPLAGHQQDLSLVRLAQQALHPGGADRIILTDPNLSPTDIQAVAHAIDAPVLYDYAQPLAEAEPYLKATDGLILSSILKKSSGLTQDTRPTVDLTKVEEIATIADVVRSSSLSRT